MSNEVHKMPLLNQDYAPSPVVNALTLSDDDLVGKTVRYKNPKWPAEQGTFTVGGRQKVWGNDENGKYTIIEGYRIFNQSNNDDFGRPVNPSEIEIVEPVQEEVDLTQYDKILVMFSAGKDSTATFLYLLEQGVPVEKIELWHHDVDGRGSLFMDWESTPGYCRAFADAFGVPIFFSWKDGGFEREMSREESLTAPIFFEEPVEGTPGLTVVRQTGGTRGKPSTRRKFPQVSVDLSVRWCSPYLKIDVGTAAIRNQERFNGKKTLVVSGERGEESKARASYAIFEPDRADNRDGRSKRHVDRFRPIRDWSESEVWSIIERFRVRVHPAYYLGFGRVSCKFCIFGSRDQLSSAFAISPEQGQRIANYEEQFGVTMKRKERLVDFIASGTPYPMDSAIVSLATSDDYQEPIFTDNWVLPSGAFGESCGPV